LIITLSEIIETRAPYEKLLLRYLISVITEKAVACFVCLIHITWLNCIEERNGYSSLTKIHAWYSYNISMLMKYQTSIAWWESKGRRDGESSYVNVGKRFLCEWKILVENYTLLCLGIFRFILRIYNSISNPNLRGSCVPEKVGVNQTCYFLKKKILS